MGTKDYNEEERLALIKLAKRVRSTGKDVTRKLNKPAKDHGISGAT